VNLHAIRPECQVWSFDGVLEVVGGTKKWSPIRAITILRVDAYVDDAPTGAAVIFDVHSNGTTLFTTQGNRPTIAISGTSDTNNVPDDTAVAAGEVLTIDIDQIGSSTPGSDATVIVWYT
jgi:hypothetical protein